MPYVKAPANTLKCGMIVKRFWNELVRKNDEHYTPTYKIHFRSGNSNDTSHIEYIDRSPITSHDEAVAVLRTIVEDSSNEWTYGYVVKQTIVHRAGIEWDHKAMQARAARIRAQEPENATR